MYIDPLIYDDDARSITAALLGDCATIDDNDLTIHEAVPVAANKRSELGKLGGPPRAPLRDPKVMHLQKTFGESVPEVGVEDTGSDGVD